MHIRTATEADRPAVLAIYNASIPGRLATADTAPLSLDQRRSWFDAHGPKRPLWVAKADGQVVGYVSLRDHYGRPAYHITAEVAVYVHPEHHRRGIARSLLQHALDAAPTLGIENVLAIAFAHNTASIALFKRFGFEQWGMLPGVAELDGRRADVVYLGKKV